MTAAGKATLGLKADRQDEEIIKEVIALLREKELTVDRATRILADAQIMIPLITKLQTV